MLEFNDLSGYYLESIDIDEYASEVIIKTSIGIFRLYHEQECCEEISLTASSIPVGFTNSQIILAEERYEDWVTDYGIKGTTFYELATEGGAVTLCFHGESNGYYSIGVDIERLEKAPEFYYPKAGKNKKKRKNKKG